MSDQRIYLSQPPLIVQTNQPAANTAKAVKPAASGPTFEQLLSKELAGVTFSQHAMQRMNSRNISFNAADLAKLNQAVAKAEQKGAKESLILMNDMALVVSVKNKTVITAMDGASMRNAVFTNIDSAVIV